MSIITLSEKNNIVFSNEESAVIISDQILERNYQAWKYEEFYGFVNVVRIVVFLLLLRN